MNTDSTKQKVRAVIYGIFALVLALILLRSFFMLIGANETSSFVRLIYSASYPFISMFENAYDRWLFNAFQIETAAIVAVLVYFAVSFVIDRVITSFFESDPKYILLNLVDAFFKFAEFALLFRFLFRLTGASVQSDFIDFIYKVSFFIYEPFIGILPRIEFGPGNRYVLEMSTLIAIIVVVIFDVISEGIISNLINGEKKTTESNNNPYQPTNYPIINNVAPQQPAYAPPPMVQPSHQPTNITINMPANGQQPTYNQAPRQRANLYSQDSNNRTTGYISNQGGLQNAEYYDPNRNNR